MDTCQDENVGGEWSGFTLKCLTSSSLGEVSAVSIKESTFLYFEQNCETEYRNPVWSQNTHTDVLLKFSVFSAKPTAHHLWSSQDTLSNRGNDTSLSLVRKILIHEVPLAGNPETTSLT